MKSAILFRKCLGFSDARTTSTFRVDPRNGATELSECLNITTTPDGCVEKIPALVPVLTHSGTINRIAAGKRFVFADATNTLEWLGNTSVVNRFPLVTGPIVHTPLDVRVSNGATTVYKSNSSPPQAMAEAVAGVYAGPPIATPFYAMPPFDGAFVYNAKLYVINHADPRFLMYSEDYHYDLWNRGDGYLSHVMPVLQAGAVTSTQPGLPGCILALGSDGVTVTVGSGPADFVRKFYPCSPLPGTLSSGFIGKVNGYGHVFLCSDGVYLVGPDGSITNMTVDSTDHLDALNSAYTCATMQDGKYLAFGDTVCMEYDFKTKTVLKRSPFGVASATRWNGDAYVATGTQICTLGTEIDTGSTFQANLTLPYSDLGAMGAKSIEAFYFTGRIDDGITITATDSTGKNWCVDVPDIGTVTDYRIKTPKGRLGNHISFSVECSSGAFRMEELRAVFASSQRSR